MGCTSKAGAASLSSSSEEATWRELREVFDVRDAVLTRRRGVGGASMHDSNIDFCFRVSLWGREWSSKVNFNLYSSQIYLETVSPLADEVSGRIIWTNPSNKYRLPFDKFWIKHMRNTKYIYFLQIFMEITIWNFIRNSWNWPTLVKFNFWNLFKIVRL